MRRVCPKCGSKNIKVVDDKSRPISHMGLMTQYAKKYICKDCTYSWTDEEESEEEKE